jgi:hypothetical protein
MRRAGVKESRRKLEIFKLLLNTLHRNYSENIEVKKFKSNVILVRGCGGL